MAPIKRKRCCVPYCNNTQELSKKQFFKIGANLEGRGKWLSNVGKAVAAKSQVLYCCEDHFDLPNDAENYIRYKYVPDTKLKLRPNVLPQKKLPVNVCRLCLKLIYNGDDFVDISEKKGGKNSQVIAATLPELDLSLTIEPVVCARCFEPLEQYCRIKQNTLKSEVMVVNCIKTIVKRSPTRLIKSCEIDLFEEYNDIRELLEKEKDTTKVSLEQNLIGDQSEPSEIEEDKQEMDKNTEEIVIQIEEVNEDKNNVESVQTNSENESNQLRALLEGKSHCERNSKVEQGNIAYVENIPCNNSSGTNIPKIDHLSDKIYFTIQNVSLPDKPSGSVENSENIQYEVVDNTMAFSSENVYIHDEKETSENVVIVAQEL